MADSNNQYKRWGYDMTRKEAEELQAGEYLYYTKKRMTAQAQKRVAARVAAIAADTPSAPSWKQIVAAGLPKEMLDDCEILEVKHEVAADEAARATGRKPAPRSPSYFDSTWGGCESPRPKRAQSYSRKRSPSTPTPAPMPPPKRSSPEAVAANRADMLPVAKQVVEHYPSAFPKYPLPKPVPATIRELWQKVDLPGSPFDPAPCVCPNCPYTTGAPMTKRWNLMVALVNLENFLWYGR